MTYYACQGSTLKATPPLGRVPKGSSLLGVSTSGYQLQEGAWHGGYHKAAQAQRPEPSAAPGPAASPFGSAPAASPFGASTASPFGAATASPFAQARLVRQLYRGITIRSEEINIMRHRIIQIGRSFCRFAKRRFVAVGGVLSHMAAAHRRISARNRKISAGNRRNSANNIDGIQWIQVAAWRSVCCISAFFVRGGAFLLSADMSAAGSFRQQVLPPEGPRIFVPQIGLTSGGRGHGEITEAPSNQMQTGAPQAPSEPHHLPRTWHCPTPRPASQSSQP